ncbi:MAG: BMC domain-containing protein [Propionibacteriaceae bacterium]|jgi:ethanolamine utilization protein EutS|nr:BMC domain-containing protein [Propionibacteriaceae bacterium]
MAQEKQRIIQEFVPGKQVTLAHVIARPTADLRRKVGLAADGASGPAAIGILTITPSEASIIAADAAVKSGAVEIGFVDRFSGSVLLTGDIEAVEAALQGVLRLLSDTMGFARAELTRS